MSNYSGAEIAIIGMAGQFPGADNVRQFWENLKNGVESISVLTDDELLSEEVPELHLKDPAYVKANAYLRNKEFFDADFFGYLPAEARLMDPQIRIFHQTCWSALEDAGYGVRQPSEKIGLFAGGPCNNNWMNFAMIANNDNLVDAFTASHLRDVTYLCAKVSYALNLQGPSVFMNTACSTSLVAVQKACMSLLLRECTMALAGGVRVNNFSKRGYHYLQGMINSPDGHCRTFDINANGTVGGEGVGIVVLKRLEDALKDNDNIFAVIKGSAINNDGNQKISFTAPSIDGQSKTIMKAMRMARVEPESISYVEAHGTATKLGDPIEIEALNLAFGQSTEKYCAIGSVKTNIGHVDTAAGVAGLIKTAMALHEKKIPASLYFIEPNPKINFNNSPFYVNTQLTEWVTTKYPRRAGVSSFGIGGTNAHVILEEAPQMPDRILSERNCRMLLLSAKTPTALNQNISQLRDHLQQNENLNLADVAYTLHVGRAPFKYRKAVICENLTDAIQTLGGSVSDTVEVPEGMDNFIAFMFTGQGSQYTGMCADLYEHEPLFRENVDNCFAIVKARTGKNIREGLFAHGDTGHIADINQTQFTQPALFIVEYAIAQLLISCGVKPNVMIGHSIGEYVAACISGVLSLEDALFVVTKRAELMQRMPGGDMVGVSASVEKVTELVQRHSRVSLAAINSSEQSVVSGQSDAVENFMLDAGAAGIDCKKLHTSHAFHSYMMDEILQEFKAILSSVQFTPEQSVPFVSNLTGQLISNAQAADPDYWVSHLRNTVRFAEGLDMILANKKTLLIEVGPGTVLSSFARSNKNFGEGHRLVSTIRHKNEVVNDTKKLLTAIGKLWANGCQINGRALFSGEEPRKISLPAYAFDRIKYPVNVDSYKMISDMISAPGFKAKPNPRDWFYEHAWELRDLVNPDAPVSQKLNVIFHDSCGAAASIKVGLEMRAQKIINIYQGHAFSKLSENSFEINPRQYGDFIKLADAAGLYGEMRIIFAWGIDHGDAQMTVDKIPNFLDIGYYSLLNIAKAIVHSGKERNNVDLVSITTQAYKVFQQDLINAAKATTIGALKIISKEHPRIKCRNIDLHLFELNNNSEALIDDLLSESGPTCIAYRGQGRYVQTLRNVKLKNTALNNPFISGAAYLLTGGAGAMALSFVRHISKDVAGITFVLIGRKPLPAKSTWKKWLIDNEPKHEFFKIIEQFVEIENNYGAILHYFSVDVSDKEQLEGVITYTQENVGKIRGVIHAAGVPDYAGVIYRRTRQQDFDLFNAKIAGTILLDALLPLSSLDFFILCSSASTIYRPFGQAGYVAANLFLEAYAKNKYRETNCKVISIGWNAWKEAGMAVDAAERKGSKGVFADALTAAEGYAVLLHAIQNASPAVIISNQDIVRIFESADDASPSEEDNSVHPARVPEAVDNGTVDLVLVNMWQNYFGKSLITVDSDFFELGGDSLKALTIIGYIHKTFGVQVPISEFFQRPTIGKLSEYITPLAEESIKQSGYSKIPKADPRDYYPLSSAQQRLYVLHQFEPASIAYNMPQIVKLEGRLDRVNLTAAFTKLLARHASLCTSFHVVDGVPLQMLNTVDNFDIEYYQGSSDGIRKIYEKFVRPFVLEHAPLVRVGIIEIDAQNNILMVDMHHIICDGLSHNILISDLIAFFNNTVLPELQLQYTDYAVWQQSAEQKTHFDSQREFWKNEFSIKPDVLELPVDFDRPLVKKFNGNSISFDLTETQTLQLKTLAESQQCTLFMVMLAIYNIFLHKLSGEEDVVVGTGAAGRSHADLQNMIGMFVNTLAIRNYPRRSVSFIDFLESVKSKALRCFENQGFQYEALVDELKVDRNMGRNPLFDVFFAFQNFQQPDVHLQGLTLRSLGDINKMVVSKFDLTLTATDDSRHPCLILNFEYCTELFKEASIQRFISYFKRIVDFVVRDPKVTIGEIKIYADEERSLLTKFQNLHHPKKSLPPIADMFELRAKENPNSIAFLAADEKVTYQRLNLIANNLAHSFKSTYGLGAGDLVGIVTDNSRVFLTYALALMKVSVRCKVVKPDTNSSAVNSGPTTFAALIGAGEYRIQFNSYNYISTDELLALPLDDSIGNPKRVESGKLDANNFVDDEDILTENYIGNVLCLWPIEWAVTQNLCLQMMASGATLCCPANPNPAVLTDFIRLFNIDQLNITPRGFLQILQQAKSESYRSIGSLQRVMLSGSNISATREFSNWLESQHCFAQITHCFTIPDFATTIACAKITSETISQFDTPRFDTPNQERIYVLDADFHPAPIGVTGDVYINLSIPKMYLSTYELPAARFHDREGLGSIYYTGVVGKWLDDGSLYILGEKESIVKLNGYRFDPLAIENALLSHEEIIDSFVLLRENHGTPTISTYYSSERPIEPDALRLFLSERLPTDRIPFTYQHVDSIPFDAAGSVDLMKLPIQDARRAVYIAPANELEKALAELWQKMLGKDLIGTHDNFFELGGNSLLTMRLLTAMKKEMNLDIPMRVFFKTNTVKLLAQWVEVNNLNSDVLTDYEEITI
jgi:iturin family lipopeptide synthetase A